MATLMRNTDKDYPCTQCGSLGNIVREGPTPSDTRIKCNSCNFMYSAADSLAAAEQGAIPDGPPKLTDPVIPEAELEAAVTVHQEQKKALAKANAPETKIPRSPSYVLVSKDRTRTEFATKKSLRQTVLRWEYENTSFDVFELQPKSVSTKVDIS